MKGRLLWLVYERAGHPDAVAHPATEGEVALVLDWLEKPLDERTRLVPSLARCVERQRKESAFARRPVPLRNGAGLYVPVPWRLVWWLSRLMGAAEAVIERTRVRLARWLADGGTVAVHANGDSV